MLPLNYPEIPVCRTRLANKGSGEWVRIGSEVVKCEDSRPDSDPPHEDGLRRNGEIHYRSRGEKRKIGFGFWIRTFRAHARAGMDRPLVAGVVGNTLNRLGSLRFGAMLVRFTCSQGHLWLIFYTMFPHLLSL